MAVRGALLFETAWEVCNQVGGIYQVLRSKAATIVERWNRDVEERLLKLCASGDFRPSRWRRAGEPAFMAALAAMLGALDIFDRPRLFALAEALHPGMSSAHEFEKWLAGRALDPARFLPMVRARLS